MIVAIFVMLGLIVLCIFITLWVFIGYCSDSRSWIFDRDFYRKDKVLEEIKKLRKEISELRNPTNNIGFFGGKND